MYICICNAVTDRDIVQAVHNGAQTLRQLRHELGVAAECGRCASCARDCLRNTLAEQHVNYALSASTTGSQHSLSSLETL